MLERQIASSHCAQLRPWGQVASVFLRTHRAFAKLRRRETLRQVRIGLCGGCRATCPVGHLVSAATLTYCADGMASGDREREVRIPMDALEYTREGLRTGEDLQLEVGYHHRIVLVKPEAATRLAYTPRTRRLGVRSSTD